MEGPRGGVAITVVGTAYVDVKPETSGFAAEAEKGILGSIGSIAKKAAGVFAAGFVVKQGFDFLGGLVKDASESRRVLAETEQAIKATGGAAGVSAKQVSDLAESLSRKTGIDDELIQTGSNLLLTFKNIRNEAGAGNDIFTQANRAVLDLSKQFGGVEGSAVQLGKALNDPVAGITALARAGVTFTDQQKDQIKTLVESGDVLGAQKIILKEINSQVGGQAAAQATAADRLRVVWGNLREELGARLLPIVDKVATFLADRLPGGLDAATRGFGAVLRVIRPAVDAIRLFIGSITGAGADVDLGKWTNPIISAGATIRTVFDRIVQAIQLVIIGFKNPEIGVAVDSWQGFMVRLGQVINQVAGFVKDNLQPILIGLGVTFALIVSPIGTLIAGLVLLYTRFEGVRTVVDAVVGFLTNTVAPAVAAFAAYLAEQFGNLVGWVQQHWAAIQEAIGHVIVVVQTIIETFVQVVQALWQQFGDELTNVARTVWDQIRNIVETTVGIIQGVIETALALINGDWGAAWDGIKSILATAWDFMVETVRNALGLLREALEAGLSAVMSMFGEVPVRIRDALGDVGDILYGAGKAIIGGLLQGIKDQVAAVYDFVSGIAGKIADLKGPLDKDKRLLVPAGVAIMRGLEQGIASQEAALAARLGRITSTISNLGGTGNFSVNGVGGGATSLSISGPLVVVQGSVAPGQEGQVGNAVRQAVVGLVRDGTLGREMSKRAKSLPGAR